MKRLLVIVGLLVLAKGMLFALSGCGVEGAPQPPGPPPGVSITGDARIGVEFRD
jgi:hypothetical protein